MNYYCKNCESVFELGKKIDLPIVSCPFCEDYGFLSDIPDYETPVMYKNRTKKRYPDEGAVWVRHKTEGYFKEYWQLSKYLDTKNGDCLDLNCLVVIASPPVPPPDDFVPVEEDNA